MALSLTDLSKKVRGDTAGGRSAFGVLVEMLGSKERRNIAHNTDLARVGDGEIAVILHWTRILVFNINNTVTLRSGGWNSPTTRARINTFAPNGPVTFRVYTKKYELRVVTMRRNSAAVDDIHAPYWLDIEDKPFTEGTVIDLDTGAISYL